MTCTPTKKGDWARSSRLAGLRRFAIAITAFNILGFTVFGFEQSWLQPFVAVFTAYAVELLLEFVDAHANKRPARYRGGVVSFIDFLLSAHISALAINMLLYANDRLWVIAFGVAVAIGSKAMFRLRVGERTCHFLNPSNFGITVVLLLFPWVGIAPPYHFTVGLSGAGDWILPAIIVVSGSLLNTIYTKRLPLLIAWVAVFALQAVLRSVVFGTPLFAPLLPISGVAFVLFTFYMVTDPATTPSKKGAQIVFGGSVALMYGLLLVSHVVFGFFFALTAVCAARGVVIYMRQRVPMPALETVNQPDPGQTPAVAGGVER